MLRCRVDTFKWKWYRSIVKLKTSNIVAHMLRADADVKHIIIGLKSVRLQLSIVQVDWSWPWYSACPAESWLEPSLVVVINHWSTSKYSLTVGGIPSWLEMLAGQCDGRQADDDFRRWVRTTVLFLAVSGLKFMKFLGQCRGPFILYNAISQLFISCSLSEIWPSKLPLSCEVIENR